MTRQIVDEVRPRQRYLRSANVEQHATFGVDDYIPTGRALEVLHRVARALRGHAAGRAWSLTGPYGSGKSSFALFLHALLGPADARQAAANAALESVDADLAGRISARRDDLAAGQAGFLRAVATAQAEPAARTVLRALNAAVTARWKSRPPAAVSAAALRALAEPTPRSLGQFLDALVEHAPVVIVLDEFGKNLEHFAADPEAGDLFVLQELAERCSAGRGRHPALLLTLQHLAFDDYVRGASTTQRREWGKVQGRFEDVPFLDSADQTLRLIPAAFDDHDASASFRRRRSAWATEQRQVCADLGLQRLLPDAPDLLERCYPLHPLVVLALPELCSRFGQHGRTLFAFLTGHEPGSVGEFLQQTLPSRGPLPSVDLDRLYDFFAGPGLSGTSSHASRWLEIDTVLREATGLNEAEQRVLKTVGVLNLLSQGGPLRAHPGVLGYATPSRSHDSDETSSALLPGLVERGLMTYRSFADEYRLWQGSDLDLARIVGEEREALTGMPIPRLLTNRHQMPPAIASRHTQKVGMIRYFDTAFADGAQARVPAAEPGADGLLVYWLGAADDAANIQIDPADLDRRLPVVVATTTDHLAIAEAVLELVAVEKSLDRADVSSDRVARRELQERAVQARRRLDDLLAQHLRPNAPGSTYQRAKPAGAAGGETQDRRLTLTPLAPSRSMSGLLSDVCDDAYCHSPQIRNEMLGRRQLTSQAARARRELLEAMVTHPDIYRHGLQGYGPEVAMYEALLAHSGLHQPVDERQPEGPWHFTNPLHGSAVTVAWGRLKTLLGQANQGPISLDRAYTQLQAPPIGLKEGPLPLLLAALLLQHADTVAIYQDDSYQPQLSADLLERLVKSPDRFTIKSFDADGTRSEVLRRLRKLTPVGAGSTAAGPRRRNSTVLEVAAPLITAVAALPTYTRKASRLPEQAKKVRDALLSARQPDELLFTDLPHACGIEPFLPGEVGRGNDAEAYGDRLEAAMTDLDSAYAQLLADSAALVAANFATEFSGLHDVPVLRTRLRNASAPLADVQLLDRRLKAFVLAVLDTRDSDQAWLESLLSLVAGMPAVSWQDSDLARYRTQLPDLAEQLRRLVALHTAAAAVSHEGFDAHRVTLTRPNGHEQHQVVWLNHRTAPELDAILDAALDSARAVLDVHGDAALLALLADRVMSAPHDSLNSAPPTTTATTAPIAKEQAHG